MTHGDLLDEETYRSFVDFHHRPRSGEVNEWPGKIRAMGDFPLLKQIILGGLLPI